jgi:mannose-6-phosphate isomerase-like protein (cupin superfamily)
MPRKPASPKSSQPESAKSNSTQPTAAQSRSVSRENAEHYRWGNDCDGWHLVKDAQLSVIEELIPPGAAEVRHHHERAQQFFYVLAGEVLMEVEGEMTLVHAGCGIRVLPVRGIRSGTHRRAPRGFLWSRNPQATATVWTND